MTGRVQSGEVFGRLVLPQRVGAMVVGNSKHPISELPHLITRLGAWEPNAKTSSELRRAERIEPSRNKDSSC